jgi:hypothetical protein
MLLYCSGGVWEANSDGPFAFPAHSLKAKSSQSSSPHFILHQPDLSLPVVGQ